MQVLGLVDDHPPGRATLHLHETGLPALMRRSNRSPRQVSGQPASVTAGNCAGNRHRGMSEHMNAPGPAGNARAGLIAIWSMTVFRVTRP
jgi:hypothetical protein